MPPRVIAIVALATALSGCDGPRSPTAPGNQAALALESGSSVAMAPECCEPGPFTYRMSLVLRETAGVGATIERVTATLADSAGGVMIRESEAVDVFGANRIAGGGRLISTGIAATGRLASARQLTVRLTFTDDNGHGGDVEASASVVLDLDGTWTGPLPIKTDPPGDWSSARLVLVHDGDTLGGEVVSREGSRFPLAGSVSSEWAPYASLEGLPGTSTCAGVILTFSGFEFAAGQIRRVSGHANGRCFGTVAGTFDLQRGG